MLKYKIVKLSATKVLTMLILKKSIRIAKISRTK